MRKTLLRSILFATMFVVGVFLLMMALNLLNNGLSYYLTASGHEIEVDEMEDRLYTVENIEAENSESTLIVKSDSLRPISVLIDNLEFLHKITVNGKLVSQNLDAAAAYYDSDYAYKTIEIGEPQYINGKAVIQVTGSGAPGVQLYLADSNIMQAAAETRTICYAVMLTCLFLIFLFCLVHYFYDRRTRYYLLFATNAAVSIIKSVNLGELFVMADVFGFTARSYAITNSITGNINNILTIFIMLNLMQITVNRWCKASILLLFLPLTFLALPTAPYAAYSFLQFALMVAYSGLTIYGGVRKKPFGVMLFILNMMFLSFLIYGTPAANQWYRSGTLDFYVFFPYLGNIICLSAILLAFMKSQLLKTKELEAQEKDFERISLLQGIGHDLKLPLSIIKTSNQMLLKYDVNEETQKEYAQMSLEAASELEKMTKNISSFLSLSGYEDKALSSSLSDGFDNAKKHFSAYALTTGHRFTAEWEGNDALLPTHAVQLQRMLFNLLDNAFKYTKPGGDISLSCQIDSNKAVIRVSDSGIGMDEMQIKQIFTPFYRAQKSRTTNGLGLGLCVVKRIVDSLNGTIVPESEKESGTTFTVILPIS